MLLPLLLASLVTGASPSSTVVIVTRRTAVSPADAKALAMLVTKALAAAGVDVAAADLAARRLASLGVDDTSLCAGRKGCIQEFGRQLDVAAVVGLSVSELDQDRSLSLEMVRVTDGAVLARENLLYANRASPPADQLTAFSERARAALPARSAELPPAATASATAPPAESPSPAPATDSPVAPVLTPAQPDSPAVSARPDEPAGPSHTGTWLAGGGAVLAAAAAVTLGILAFSARAELSRGQPTGGGLTLSPLSGREAQAVSARANGEFVGAGICAALGVGLGTTAVLLW